MKWSEEDIQLWLQKNAGKRAQGKNISGHSVMGEVVGYTEKTALGFLAVIGEEENAKMSQSDRNVYRVPMSLPDARHGSVCHVGDLTVFEESPKAEWTDESVDAWVEMHRGALATGKAAIGSSVTKGTVTGWKKHTMYGYTVVLGRDDDGTMDADSRKEHHVPATVTDVFHGIYVKIDDVKIVDASKRPPRIETWLNNNAGKMGRGLKVSGTHHTGRIVGIYAGDKVILEDKTHPLMSEKERKDYKVPELLGFVRHGFPVPWKSVEMFEDLVQKPVVEKKVADERKKAWDKYLMRNPPQYRYAALTQVYAFLAMFNESYEDRETQREYQAIMQNRFNPDFNPERIFRFLCYLDVTKQPSTIQVAKSQAWRALGDAINLEKMRK